MIIFDSWPKEQMHASILEGVSFNFTTQSTTSVSSYAWGASGIIKILNVYAESLCIFFFAVCNVFDQCKHFVSTSVFYVGFIYLVL